MEENKTYDRWFAWYPVKTDKSEWAWLETVNRVHDLSDGNQLRIWYYR